MSSMDIKILQNIACLLKIKKNQRKDFLAGEKLPLKMN